MSYEDESKAESAMRARVAGKEAVAQRTVWTFTLAHLHFRCLAEPSTYVVQVKIGQTPWTSIKDGSDAQALLRHTLSVKTVTEAFQKYPEIGV